MNKSGLEFLSTVSGESWYTGDMRESFTFDEAISGYRGRWDTMIDGKLFVVYQDRPWPHKTWAGYDELGRHFMYWLKENRDIAMAAFTRIEWMQRLAPIPEVPGPVGILPGPPGINACPTSNEIAAWKANGTS